jgi:hypothetical protein
VRGSARHGPLTRSRLLHATVGVADRVARADDRLADRATGDEVSVTWISRELGAYVRAAAVARATPPASAEVAEALRDAA